MNLTKGIPVRMGPLDATVFGGPFRKYVPGTRRLIGIKMAEEIDHPHDFAVDTEDFSVPLVLDMQEGLIAAINAFADGKDVYVGCMGGIGRTGLFMGCMAKVMKDFAMETEGDTGEYSDPVVFVREYYIPHAIETRQQQDYVRTFNTAPVLKHIRQLLAPEVIIDTVIEVRTEYLSPLQALSRWWYGI